MFEKVCVFWLVLWIFCGRAAREDERRREGEPGVGRPPSSPLFSLSSLLLKKASPCFVSRRPLSASSSPLPPAPFPRPSLLLIPLLSLSSLPSPFRLFFPSFLYISFKTLTTPPLFLGPPRRRIPRRRLRSAEDARLPPRDRRDAEEALAVVYLCGFVDDWWVFFFHLKLGVWGGGRMGIFFWGADRGAAPGVGSEPERERDASPELCHEDERVEARRNRMCAPRSLYPATHERLVWTRRPLSSSHLSSLSLFRPPSFPCSTAR